MCSELESTKAGTDSFVGTVTYMSPERLDGQQYSFSADIWGLGISLIQLATGEHPYEGMTASQETEMKFWTLVTHLKERPAPTPQGNFSAEFKDFVSQCLFKEKEKRASAGDLLEHPWIKLYASGLFVVRVWTQGLGLKGRAGVRPSPFHTVCWAFRSIKPPATRRLGQCTARIFR